MDCTEKWKYRVWYCWLRDDGSHPGPKLLSPPAAGQLYTNTSDHFDLHKTRKISSETNLANWVNNKQSTRLMDEIRLNNKFHFCPNQKVETFKLRTRSDRKPTSMIDKYENPLTNIINNWQIWKMIGQIIFPMTQLYLNGHTFLYSLGNNFLNDSFRLVTIWIVSLIPFLFEAMFRGQRWSAGDAQHNCKVNNCLNKST